MTHDPYHIIFEGAELTGKSFVISQIYNYLEKKYSSIKYPHLLDGCFWINADIGVFGSEQGKILIENYLSLAKKLKNNNIIFEKFHLTDQVYSWLYRKKNINYKKIERELKRLNFKIIFLYIDSDITLFKKRLTDRISLYPHYKRIKQTPVDYIDQQKKYEYFLKKTNLPYLKINTSQIPNKKIIKQILQWLEKK
jgi:thymidylate kinase